MSVDVFLNAYDIKELDSTTRRQARACVDVYVAILRGEFDDQLHWPLDCSVTIQAYNRTIRQWSNEHTIVLNQKGCGLKSVERCVDTMGRTSSEVCTFLSLSQLKKDYSKGTDMLKFRVTEVLIK